jgi:hypothetical protein
LILTWILEALTAKKVPFVLTGAHGISSWTGLPRATHDVDILVKSGSNYARRRSHGLCTPSLKNAALQA